MLAPFQARVDWQVGYFLSSSFLYILSFIFLFSSFAFQIWFAAMSNYQNNPWLVHVIYKLLKGDHKTLALLDPVEGNPFGESQPTCIFSQPLSSHLLSPFLLQEKPLTTLRYQGRFVRVPLHNLSNKCNMALSFIQ